jgi:hypothetical protein
MKLLFVLAVVTLAGRAWAQGNEAAIALIVAPPGAMALVLDAAMLYTLVPSGTAGRGVAITNLVFGSVAMALSAFSLIPNAFGTSSDAGTVLAGVGLAVGVASIGLSIYALMHPTETPPEEAPPPPPGPSFQTPIVPRPAPPQLRVLPLISARMIGLAVAL